MDRVRTLLSRMLFPPQWVLLSAPLAAFASLLLLLHPERSRIATAYAAYSLSAYHLAVLAAAAVRQLPRWRAALRENRLVRHFRQSRFGRRYLHDPAFRGSIRLYQGMTANFLYVLFRVLAGVRYASVWFLSTAIYHGVLGGLRAYLILCWRKRTPALEYRCYRRTAWLLFLLNLPMGGILLLMVLTDSGTSYPGTVIYLSALYTFCAVGLSIRSLVQFHRLGSPILSASRVLHLISTLMSVLALQSAMIAQFSPANIAFRRRMNAITGLAVWCGVILAAVVMLLRSKALSRKEKSLEPLRE